MWYPSPPLPPSFLTDSPPEPVFDLLNVFSWIQGKHSRVHVFVCFLNAVVYVMCLPHTSVGQACFVWSRGNWIQRKAGDSVSLTDSFYRSLDSTVGALASSCAFGYKLYFHWSITLHVSLGEGRRFKRTSGKQNEPLVKVATRP